MDAEAVWAKKKAALGPQALKRPANTAIPTMVTKTLDRICRLKPTEIKRCRP